jgi:hypothetical protein
MPVSYPKPPLPRAITAFLAISCVATVLALPMQAADSNANSGSVTGTVSDPSGAVVPAAVVEIHNPVASFDRSVTTDSAGHYSFANIPFNPYHLSVKAPGFAAYAQDVEVRATVALNVDITLQVIASSETVNVEAAGDLVENDPTNHTDVDRDLFNKIPLESTTSAVSSLVTLASPGVSSDSNGMFHGLGDHAQNSFSVDGQPITDQQSKVFSNQVPADSIESLEVIEGAPPAEYGGKTSLVIVANTRSGEGQTTPTGSLTTSYGSFGTSGLNADLAYGGKNWGNFLSADVNNGGRFLDAPEFAVMHDKGNQQNFFDRVDLRVSSSDTLQFNFGYSRSWFQSPNSYDQEFHFGLTNPITGAPLTATDQRQKINTFNIAPSWSHVVNNTSVLTIGGFVRRDDYNYYPTADPFSDYSPDLQSETVGQNRTLTNAGIRGDITYVKGIHNVKAGVLYSQTFLDENDQIGIVDPTLYPTSATFYNCLDVNGNPLPNTPCAALKPFDLTQGGVNYNFLGHTDVKEFGTYIQDTITVKNWSFNLGLRGDIYNGLSSGNQAEPRLGVSYNIKPTSTILRISYARSLETPFNENLIIASNGCDVPFLAALVPPLGVPCKAGPITPGYRNEFHAGLQQAVGRHIVINGEYIWKYTHNAFDFGVVGNTPITFPIEWKNSKIPGFTLRVSVPSYRGFSGYVAMSSVSARFFQPQVAGLPIVPPSTGVFRIDHDERFNQTTHFQYQPKKTWPWLAMNWRYDSGQVAGSTPCYNLASATCLASSTSINGQPAVNLVNTNSGAPLTADQEFQAGFTCNGQRATITQALPTPCLATQFNSTLIRVPAPGTQNDDSNPQRIRSRNLFDLSLGDDNLFHNDRYKWSLQLTAVNLTNKYALYNFLSTFSGTHYVTPRTLTVALGFHF